MNVRYRVELNQAERAELEALLSGGKHAVRKLKRAQILLAADGGASDEAIVASVAVGDSTVYRTKRRFVEGNLAAALSEEPRPRARRKLTGNEEALLLATACSNTPAARPTCASGSSATGRGARRRAPASAPPGTSPHACAASSTCTIRRPPRSVSCSTTCRPIPLGRSTRPSRRQRRTASCDASSSITPQSTLPGSTWSRSRSASCAASASTAASPTVKRSTPRPPLRSRSATLPTLASNACSPLSALVKSSTTPILSQPKSHNLCAKVLVVVAAHRRSAVALAFLLARRTTSAGLAAAFAGWAVPSDDGIHVPVTCSANA